MILEKINRLVKPGKGYYIIKDRNLMLYYGI